MRDLLHDVSPSPELDFSPKEDRYSPYSVGILWGIFAVALYLFVAIISSANVAMASHLSLHPPRKKFNFEMRLIFCMLMQFAAALLSGVALFSLTSRIEHFFAVGVGISFSFGLFILTNQITTMFGLNSLKRVWKTPLLALLIALSSVAFLFAGIERNEGTMWVTTIAYCFTFAYQLLVACQSIPFSYQDEMSIAFPWILCLFWAVGSLLPFVLNSRGLFTIAVSATSGLESILLAYIGIVGMWKNWRQNQRHIQVPSH